MNKYRIDRAKTYASVKVRLYRVLLQVDETIPPVSS